MSIHTHENFSDCCKECCQTKHLHTETLKRIPKIYSNALESQSACNASGLIKQLALDVDLIWEEARAEGKGTDYVNQHPVIRLYLEQLLFLNNYTSGSYSQAHDICTERSRG